MRTNKIIEELKKKHPGEKIEDVGGGVKIGRVFMNWKRARELAVK